MATYNRAALLPRLFDALGNQTVPADQYEIVIVDDASADDTGEVLARIAEASPVSVRVLRQPKNAGPATARNRGAAEAHADIVAFTDDDCVPSPGWLEAGLSLAGPSRIVVGRTEPAEGQPRGPFSRTLKVTDTRFMQTCNIFYTRQDLVESGGFDERFRRAAGEDTDLGLRLQEAGAEAVFAHDALVHHDVRPSSFRDSFREAWGKWIDLPLVVKLHPQTRDRLAGRIFWKRTHPLVIVAVIGIGAVPATPWALLGVAPWLGFRSTLEPLTRHRLRRFTTLPGAFAIDLAEVVAMIRGSIRHRGFML